MAVHWLLLNMLVLLIYKECQCQGDSCTSGFLSTDSVTPCITGCYIEDKESAITRLIPEVNFTCNGTVTKWRAAARLNTQSGHNSNTVLGIWRQRNSGSRSYDRISTIELGVCGSGVEPSVVMSTGSNTVYDCTLPENSRVTVQTGDIVGLEFAGRDELRFTLLLDNSRGVGPQNYVFGGRFSSIDLSESLYTSRDILQISLTVEPIMEVVTTTEPQTEASTTESSIAETTLISTTFTNSNTIGPTATMEMAETDATKSEITTLIEVSFIEDRSDTVSEDVIVGAVAAVLVALALLFAVILVLAYLSQKLSTRGGEVKSQRDSDLKKDLENMEYNDAYIPQIPTKCNVAYGQAANQDTTIYDTIVDIEPSSSNTMTREVSVSNV